MKILVIGSGGREHALAWCLARSPRVQEVIVAPGNGGTAREPRTRNIPVTRPLTLAALAERERVAFSIVGPEAPLAAGLVDIFRQRGLRIFGPTQAAAQLESSKDFAKSFMRRHGIPSAASETFTEARAAHEYIEAQGAPIVVKADGLAAGKGVIVALEAREAHAAVDLMLTEGRMGAAGARIIVEEYLDGEEASFIVMADGRNVLALASSQDHKRLLDGDLGPNTGGMGAYSPAAVITPTIHARVLREIIRPTIEGMAAEGMPYTGFLYAGLMIAPDGTPRTLEFNCRMGDPEAQPILARIKSDFAGLIERGIDGRLDTVEIDWDRRTALGVVLAAKGYPEAPRTGDRISGLPANGNEIDDDCIVFHGGTRVQDDQIVTAGGRVLCVTALGDSVKMAQARAYEAAATISFDGMQYRRDIGARAIGRNSRA